MLPKCDTLVESIQLSKINNNEKSFIDMSTIDIEKGNVYNLQLLFYLKIIFYNIL